METTFWGPDGWKFLHLITYLYPDKPTTMDKYNKLFPKCKINQIIFLEVNYYTFLK